MKSLRNGRDHEDEIDLARYTSRRIPAVVSISVGINRGVSVSRFISWGIVSL